MSNETARYVVCNWVDGMHDAKTIHNSPLDATAEALTYPEAFETEIWDNVLDEIVWTRKA